MVHHFSALPPARTHGLRKRWRCAEEDDGGERNPPGRAQAAKEILVEPDPRQFESVAHRAEAIQSLDVRRLVERAQGIGTAQEAFGKVYASLTIIQYPEMAPQDGLP